jgi:cation-dependent mannose-6-phosphate receptor
MHISQSAFVTTTLLLLALPFTLAANPPAKPPAKASKSSSTSSTALPAETYAPCTLRSATSGKFFDLNPLHVALPDPDKKQPKDARTESWHARGYDYGANFTMNFCGGVVEDLAMGIFGDGERDAERVAKGVVGVEREMWANVSAFYTWAGRVYSIG